MSIRLRTLAIALTVVLALAAGTSALVVQLGVYNIAATEQHLAPVYALMDHAMRQSARARAVAPVPADIGERRRVLRGAAHFRAHCVQCHGAPGISPEPLAFGLTPAPANLVGTARHWKPGELFWVVKYGIKMTGMPAWAYRLADDEIWDVVAFVEAMAKMTPAEYASLPDAPHTHAREQPPAMNGGGGVLGNAAAGRRAATQYLCATCHVIPGFVSAGQHVGPPLGGMARRGYIGGIVPNTPANMVRWLKNPRELDPLSAMPALGLADQDARDIAAFMYTLDEAGAK